MECFKVYANQIEDRIDSSPYHPTRINTIKKIKSIPTPIKPLIEIVKFENNVVHETPMNYPYIGLENIESNTGIYSKSNEEKETFDSAHLFNKGDILFPKLRPYLNKVYLSEFDGVCSTEFHVLKSKDINMKYLFIFLNSNLVVNQTSFLMTGNTLPRLQRTDIEKLLIPIPPLEIQNKIAQIMDSAYFTKKQKEEEAQKLIDSIEDYILSELGIKILKLKESLCYRVMADELKDNRIDSYYYQSKFDEIEKSITNSLYDVKKLKDVCSKITRRFYPKKDVVYEYVQLGCIDIENASIKNTLKISLPDIPSRAQQVVIRGEILFSGSLPNMKAHALITESDYVVSSGFYILKSKSLDNFFLLTLLRLGIYSSYYLKFLTGAGLFKTISITDLMDIKIPVPPIKVQNKIADEVKSRMNKANQLRTESKTILHEARKEVERIILS